MQRIILRRGIFHGVYPSGFEWEVQDDRGNQRTYRTGRNYCGLWLLEKNGWRQILGTSQFSLSESRQAALRQIRKLHGMV